MNCLVYNGMRLGGRLNKRSAGETRGLLGRDAGGRGFLAWLTEAMRIRRACAGPILREIGVADVAMEGGKWPVDYASNEAVFDGIDMDVIAMAREVVFVAYRVFPVAVLP
jgi:hypothetical protein